MKASHGLHIKSNKFITILNPEEGFSTNLELTLSFSGEDFLENFEWGYIDFHYILFDGFPECKRIILTYQDFLDQPFSYKINTGEFLSHIKIGGFFYANINQGYFFKVEQKDNKEAYINDVINLNDLHEAILFGPTIDFLERFRSLTSEKLSQIISGELDNLEARIDEASGRVFNFWVLADVIAKMTSDSKIPESELAFLKNKYNKFDDSGNKRMNYLFDNVEVMDNQSKKTSEYLESFCLMYESFTNDNKTLLENKYPDLVIDFDDWITYPNGSGFANIWIEPKEKAIYHPSFKSPINEIEIQGILLVIKTEFVETKPNCKSVNFEVAGYFNPEEWGGRNELNLQPINQTITKGFNKIISEKDQGLSPYFKKYIQQNFQRFILESLSFYFGNKTLLANH